MRCREKCLYLKSKTYMPVQRFRSHSIVIAIAVLLFAVEAVVAGPALADRPASQPLNGEELVAHLEMRSREHWAGSQDSAMRYLRWAMEEASRDGGHGALAQVCMSLGDYYCTVEHPSGLSDSMSRYKLGFDYYRRACEHMALLDEPERLCAALKKIIDAANRLGLHGETDRYIALRISSAKPLGFEQLGEAMLDAATLYINKSDYSKAMAHLMEVLDLYKSKSYAKGYGGVYYRVGYIHLMLHNYDMAKSYARKVLSLPPEETGDFIVCNASNVMNIVFIEQQNYDSALFYSNKTMALCAKIGDTVRLVDVLNNSGYVYSHMGQYFDAIKEYNKSIELAKRIRHLGPDDEDAGTLNTRNNKALAFLDWGRVYEAEQEMKIVQNNIREIQSYRNLDETYGILAAIAQRKHDYRRAYGYMCQQRIYSDSLYNSEITASVLELQMRFESMEKERENNLLKSDLQKQERTKSIIIIVLALLVLLLSITILVVWNAKKHNRVVQHKNMLLQQAQEELLRANTQMDLANNTKDRLFAIIAHDIKNPCAAIVDFCDKLDASNPIAADQHELVGLISEGLRNLYAMLDNLLQWSRMQMGIMRIVPSRVDIGAIASREAQNLELNLRKKQIHLDNRVGSLYVYAEENSVGIIVRNLLHNAIKFTPHGGEVGISASQSGGMAEIVVSDTGAGISPAENPPNVPIDLEKLKSIAGTDSESGTGLGLSICRELVLKNGGRLWAENRPEGGAQFRFTLPLEPSVPYN